MDDYRGPRTEDRKATTATVLELIALGEALCREGDHDPRSFWLAVRIAADDRGGLTQEAKQPTEPRLGKPRKGRQVRLTDDDSMPFGKHKGERLGDVPSTYFQWFLKQPWCDDWPNLVEYANCD